MPVPKYLSLLLPDGQDEIVHVCAPDEVCIFNRRKNYTLGHEKKNQPTDPILSITSVWFLFTGGVQLSARYDLLSTGSAFTVCAIFFMAPFYQRVLRMDFNNWLSFAAASMLILILPGPTILTILSHTLTGGRRVIWAAVAAVACGDLISMSLALIGLGALLAASALSFTAFKWLGALYLIWLGINMLRTAVRSDFNAPSSDTLSSRRSIFYKLFWVTVLNPKSIGFFPGFSASVYRPRTIYYDPISRDASDICKLWGIECTGLWICSKPPSGPSKPAMYQKVGGGTGRQRLDHDGGCDRQAGAVNRTAHVRRDTISYDNSFSPVAQTI